MLKSGLDMTYLGTDGMARVKLGHFMSESEFVYTPEQIKTMDASFERMQEAEKALKAAWEEVENARREAKDSPSSEATSRLNKAFQAVRDAREERGRALIRFTLDEDLAYLNRPAKHELQEQPFARISPLSRGGQALNT